MVTAQRFRQRKLSVKQSLQILRESDLDASLDDDAARHIPLIETGVEKAEETEHHLQAVISAAQAGGTAANIYIPTPEAVASKLQYDALYPRHFHQPATYIRFSSTVEDCGGGSYCMDDEDEVFLRALNAKKPKDGQCTEDQFETVVTAFERVSETKQPFASLDPNTPILSLPELESGFEDMVDDASRAFCVDIYGHWAARRKERENHSLMPSLKFERNADTDDGDPYVCFRRREVRQVRKTRGRDAQATERLATFRRQYETSRYLCSLVLQFQRAKAEQMAHDELIFRHRRALIDAKRSLGVKDGDTELLVNQPPPQPKRKEPPRAEAATVQRARLPSQSAQMPAAVRPLESDVTMLEDQKAKRAESVRTFINEHKQRHRVWNEGYVDDTWRPITPPLEGAALENPDFVALFDRLLPTPPNSASEESDGKPADHPMPDADDALGGALAPIPRRPNANEYAALTRDPLRPFSAHSDASLTSPPPSFRIRTGRGGRIMIDRRNIPRGTKRRRSPSPSAFPRSPPPPPPRISARVLDRYAYEDDDDLDLDPAVPALRLMDPHDSLSMRHRMFFALQSRGSGGGDPAHHPGATQAAAQAAAHAHVAAAVQAAQQHAAQQGVALSPQQIQQVQRRALQQAQQGLAHAQAQAAAAAAAQAQAAGQMASQSSRKAVAGPS